MTQELLRHSPPVMTLGTYAQAVTADKREAQAAVTALYLNASKRETAASGPLTDLRVVMDPRKMQNDGFYGGRSRIRTYDFHRVKVALYR